MNADMELVKKPMAIDLIMRIVAEEGQTKTEIMRGYPDMVTRTIHFRISEMFDLGWIEYKDSIECSRMIFPTEKGMWIQDAISDMLREVEGLE